MQINRRLYLSSSPWVFPLCCDLLRKRRDSRKVLFMRTNNWMALAVWCSIKYFFVPNSLMFWIRLTEKREGEEEQANAVLCISHKSNNILLCVIFLDREYRWNCNGNTWTNTLTFIYIENTIKTSFIHYFIVTAKNLICPVAFLFFCSWWLAEE